jgi:hypothetical protein
MSQRFYLFHTDLKEPVLLKFDPVGWDSFGKTIERDTAWHGVFFKYTPKLQFVKDGRKFVQFYYEKYGIEADITLTLYKLNVSSRKWELDYTGRLDLTSLEITRLFCTCLVEQTGFIQKIKNRADILVDLQKLTSQGGKTLTPFANETQNLPLHSKAIKQVYKKTDSSGYNGYGDQVEDAYFSGTHYGMFPLDFNTSDEIGERFDYGTQLSDLNPVDFGKYFFKVKYAGSYKIITEPKFYVWSLIGGSIDVQWKLVYGHRNNYTEVNIGSSYHNGFGILGGKPSAEVIINLAAKDEIYLFAEVILGSGSATVIFLNGYSFYTTSLDELPSHYEAAKLTIEADTIYPQTNTKATLVFETWDRVVSSISDLNNRFRSTYFGRTDSEPINYAQDGSGSLRAITRGILVRGFPLTDYSIHASLTDLLKSFNAIDGIGLGVEVVNGKEYLTVEALDYFYQTDASIKLSNVTDLEKIVLDEYFYNELEVGYSKWSNEQINNLDEFNTKLKFTLPITQVKKLLSLISPYIGSGYTIEFLRRDNYRISKTKDNSLDNDTVVISLVRDGSGFKPQKNEGFTQVNNLISPETSYNLALAPIYNIIRNGARIRSGLLKQSDKNITLSFGEGNTKLTIQKIGEDLVNEKEFMVNSLSKGLWTGEGYRFKSQLTKAQSIVLEANLYKTIGISEDGVSYKYGWLIKAEPEGDANLTNFILLKANI